VFPLRTVVLESRKNTNHIYIDVLMWLIVATNSDSVVYIG